ncbi:DUF389 domain-containing protein [Polyangium spumosum]|uniref:DUF389 domain-containing protein n=1 Tax=Polyangium spumosum TaxID=889282 RepID=A0A6N7Q2I0_9BACT|nr:DUF389 domain-containing protein [Polyangium spumosum]MRG96484.1 DUF389 domain-containing protein [Polyangium spumosum]
MDKQEPTTAEVESPSFLDMLGGAQDRLALALGIGPADREATVSAMLARSPGEAVGYWLKLLLAMGIASLGLVLGSTAVVIGAMLISPLMGPIVELGMGLAVGSPLLVLRSFARTTTSVGVVVGSAALLTLALPFQEVTPEIAARTAPTALDLLIATLCAIAAAYTTIRPGSDSAGTAAGTAIGIALVPPLCVVGYGVGTGAQPIWSGAGLLFVANFCAILLFAVLCFLALGYSRASASTSERIELDRHQKGLIRRIARALRFVFGLKYGPLLRVLMPLLLVAGVYVPLREALAQVTWQVRVRAGIHRILGTLPENAVRSSVTVERDAVAVRLVTLGRAEEASQLEKDLTSRIAAIAGTVPKVQVIAVPDATALDALTSRIEASKVPVVTLPKTPRLDDTREEVARALDDAWPPAAGPLLNVRVVFPAGAPITFEVVHQGPQLGEPGVALLGAHLSRSLETEVSVRDVVIPAEPLVAEAQDVAQFLPRALGALRHLDAADGLVGCVEAPVGGSHKPNKESESALVALRALPAFQDKRIVIGEGAQWKLAVSRGPCPEAAAQGAAKPGAPFEGRR